MQEEKGNELQFFGIESIRPVEWQPELSDEEACLDTLQGIRQRLDLVVGAGKSLKKKGDLINEIDLDEKGKDLLTVARGLLEEELSFYGSLAGDIELLSQDGLDAGNSQLQDRLLSNLRSLISSERKLKGLPEDVIDMETPKILSQEQAALINEAEQQGIFNSEELMVLEKTDRYLRQKFGTPLKRISGKQASEILKEKIPVEGKK